MRLHQIKIEYNPEHDRLIMRVSTSDGQEILLWLTRRCVGLLWPALLKLAETSARVVAQASADARAALLGFEHEQAVKSADFSKPYEEEAARAHPLGADPILVSRIQTRRGEQGTYIVSLQPTSGQGLNINVDDKLLHSLCKLLQSAVAGAEWGMRLELPQAALSQASLDGAPRTLN